MTDTTPLSPAAQAVLDAAMQYEINPECYSREIAAAALRAAADQVVPPERKECEHFTNEAIRLSRMGVRAELFAIAAELNGQ